MPYLFLTGAVAGVASTGIFGSFYNRKNEGRKGAAALYSLLQMLSMCLCWAVIFALDPGFHLKVLVYALLFGGFYTLCAVGLINALKYGPVALTSLILQLSLIGVTIWGFLFWNSEITPLVVSGLVLVAISLGLCLYTGKRGDKKIDWKWLIFALLMFVGNAGCSIVQKTQQTAFEGKYGSLLMLAATGFSCLVCFAGYMGSDKTDTRIILRGSWYYPIFSGISGAALNLFVILLATSELSPSLVYPTIAVGGLAVTTVFSSFVFKEKLKWQQWLGIAFGAVAAVLLSI